MSLFPSLFRTSASGMTAQRLRLDVIANNIANANTTRTPEGGPFRRSQVIMAARQLPVDENLPANMITTENSGVDVVAIEEDSSPAHRVYDPAHPDANSDGYVEMPNTNIVTEMVDMMSATRAYEANVVAIEATKTMALKVIDISR